MYTITINDNNGDTVEQDVTITITGSNDVPVITGGPDTAGLLETNAALTGTGNLTVGDMDTTDVVTASVAGLVVSGTSDRADPAAPGDAELLAMFGVTPMAILDGSETSDTLTWSFNSGSEALDYLAAGETLILEYTVQATDDDGIPLSDTETITLTITGSNDAPSDIQLTNAIFDENGNVTVDENAPNGTIVADVEIIDVDGDTGYTITLEEDGDGAFGLGSILVEDGSLLDFESASTREVTLRVVDSNGQSLDKTFNIALNDIYEAPPVIVSNPVIAPAESSSAGSETGDFSPGTTSTAEHISETIAENQDSSDSGIDRMRTQSDTGESAELALLLNPDADPTQALDAPGAGEGDPDSVSEDGAATGEEAGDDSQEVSAEGEATQEAEGRTPLTKEVKKQSEQFEAQRKEILELFEDFGKQTGCGA